MRSSARVRLWICATVITLLALSTLASAAWTNESSGRSFQTGNSSLAVISNLIYRQKYDEAINRLAPILEQNPGNGEALTYLATANLYQGRDFSKAKKEFEEAFRAGGGASFLVTHSHERFNTGDVVDYCRGWLHLRRGEIEFLPTEGSHGFKLRYREVEEAQVNRLSKTMFHLKIGGKSENFRGRSNGDLEPLLIIDLYKSFSRE